MAKTQKKRKYTKKRKAAVTLPLFVVILIIALIVTLYILYTLGYLDRWMKPGTGGDNPGSGSGNGGESIITDDLQQTVTACNPGKRAFCIQIRKRFQRKVC